MTATPDKRNHIQSLLMRESLLDKQVIASTESNIIRQLPTVHVIKIGARSIIEQGRDICYPVVDALVDTMKDEKIVIGVGGGARTRHLFSIGIDLGLPTGVLAELSQADALGNAHILGALMAPHGVVAVPPEMFGHLLPLFMHRSQGVIFDGVPPYSLWEHPPAVGKIPQHRTDAGCLLLAETFGCKSLTLVKDVDGLYSEDPKLHPDAEFIPEITLSEIKERGIKTFPFNEILIDILAACRLVDSFQVINGLHPERIRAAVKGEHVGTIVRKG
jgi:molybdenum storage protein